MGSGNRFDGIDAYAAKIIRFKARQLVRRAEFCASDLEDLEQEMLLDLLRRLPRYDPRRAKISTFVARIVVHKVAALIEHRRAAMRDYQREGPSLNQEIAGDDGETSDMLSAVDQKAYLKRLGVEFRPQRERTDLRLAVEEALMRLPEDLRRVCEMLRSMSVQEISREVGVPRSTVYDAIKRAKAKLIEDGFQDFFRGGPTDPGSFR